MTMLDDPLEGVSIIPQRSPDPLEGVRITSSPAQSGQQAFHDSQPSFLDAPRQDITASSYATTPATRFDRAPVFTPGTVNAFDDSTVNPQQAIPVPVAAQSFNAYITGHDASQKQLIEQLPHADYGLQHAGDDGTIEKTASALFQKDAQDHAQVLDAFNKGMWQTDPSGFYQMVSSAADTRGALMRLVGERKSFGQTAAQSHALQLGSDIVNLQSAVMVAKSQARSFPEASGPEAQKLEKDAQAKLADAYSDEIDPVKVANARRAAAVALDDLRQFYQNVPVMADRTAAQGPVKSTGATTERTASGDIRTKANRPNPILTPTIPAAPPADPNDPLAAPQYVDAPGFEKANQAIRDQTAARNAANEAADEATRRKQAEELATARMEGRAAPAPFTGDDLVPPNIADHTDPATGRVGNTYLEAYDRHIRAKRAVSDAQDEQAMQDATRDPNAPDGEQIARWSQGAIFVKPAEVKQYVEWKNAEHQQALHDPNLGLVKGNVNAFNQSFANANADIMEGAGISKAIESGIRLWDKVMGNPAPFGGYEGPAQMLHEQAAEIPQRPGLATLPGRVAGGVLPIVASGGAAPFAMAAQGAGGGIQEGREQGYGATATATLAIERGIVGYLFGKFIPGGNIGKGVKPAAAEFYKAFNIFEGIGLTQAELEVELKRALGVKTDDEMTTLIRQASDGDSLATNALFAAVHTISSRHVQPAGADQQGAPNASPVRNAQGPDAAQGNAAENRQTPGGHDLQRGAAEAQPATAAPEQQAGEVTHTRQQLEKMTSLDVARLHREMFHNPEVNAFHPERNSLYPATGKAEQIADILEHQQSLQRPGESDDQWTQRLLSEPTAQEDLAKLTDKQLNDAIMAGTPADSVSKERFDALQAESVRRMEAEKPPAAQVKPETTPANEPSPETSTAESSDAPTPEELAQDRHDERVTELANMPYRRLAELAASYHIDTRTLSKNDLARKVLAFEGYPSETPPTPAVTDAEHPAVASEPLVNPNVAGAAKTESEMLDEAYAKGKELAGARGGQTIRSILGTNATKSIGTVELEGKKYALILRRRPSTGLVNLEVRDASGTNKVTMIADDQTFAHGLGAFHAAIKPEAVVKLNEESTPNSQVAQPQPEQSHDAKARSELRALQNKRFKTAHDETKIELLKGDIAANPAKWSEGQGVGYYAGVATKGHRGSQVNRGFRITSVDPETKTATIRQVADTGITVSGGNYDRIEDQRVHIADLVRDKRYDAAPKPAATTVEQGAPTDYESTKTKLSGMGWSGIPTSSASGMTFSGDIKTAGMAKARLLAEQIKKWPGVANATEMGNRVRVWMEPAKPAAPAPASPPQAEAVKHREIVQAETADHLADLLSNVNPESEKTDALKNATFAVLEKAHDSAAANSDARYDIREEFARRHEALIEQADTQGKLDFERNQLEENAYVADDDKARLITKIDRKIGDIYKPSEQPNEANADSRSNETAPVEERPAVGLADRSREPTYEGAIDKYGRPTHEYEWESAKTSTYGNDQGIWKLKPVERESLKIHDRNPVDPKDAARIIEAYNAQLKSGDKHRRPKSLDVQSLDAVNVAYRTLLKPIAPAGAAMGDTALWALPGKEKEMSALAVQMAKARDVKPYQLEMATRKLAKIKGVPVPAKTSEDVIKAVGNAAAKEMTRYAINGVKIEKGGKVAVATDGHRILIVKGDKPLGKEGLWANGKSGSVKGEKLEGTFPPYEDVVSSAGNGEKIATVDIASTLRRLRQAEVMTSEESKGVYVVLNKDGSLGFAANAPEQGMGEVGIQEGAKNLGGVNPAYLIDALEFHARMGAKSIDMRWQRPSKPVMFEATTNAAGQLLKHTSVTMPVNTEGAGYESIHADLTGTPQDKAVAEHAKEVAALQEKIGKSEDLIRSYQRELEGAKGKSRRQIYTDFINREMDNLAPLKSELEALQNTPAGETTSTPPAAIARLPGETDDAFIARKFAATKSGELLPEEAKPGILSDETKAAFADTLTALKETVLGTGKGPLMSGPIPQKLADAVGRLAYNVVRDLARAGSVKFTDFARKMSEITQGHLRSFVMPKVRQLYEAVRTHPDAGEFAHKMDSLYKAPPNARELADITRLSQFKIEQRKAIAEAQSAMPERPPTETETLHNAAVGGEETTKATILRTTGLRSTEEPTVTPSQALAEKLNVEQAMSNKAWMAQDARAKITESAKQLPRDLRGDFLHAVATAKNQSDLDTAMARMENNLATHKLREAYRVGAETLANSKLTNIPLKYAAEARKAGNLLKGALEQVRNLPNRPRPKGEPAATAEARNAYTAMIEGYVSDITNAIDAGKQVRRNEIAKAGTAPPVPSEAEKAPLARRAADTLHDIVHTREQYSYLRRDYNAAVQAAAEHRIQANKEAAGTYNRFRAEGLPRDNTVAMRVQADLVRLGWHNRVNDLRNKAFERAIGQGMTSADAEAAALRAATGIPDCGPEDAAKIKKDPLVRKAVEYWLKNVAPAQESNLRESGQSVEGWSSKAKDMADPMDGLMINLPPDRAGDTQHFGVRRRGYDQSQVLLDPTSGVGDYQKDFSRVVQNNIAYPIKARTHAELAKAVMDGGFALTPESKDVRQAEDGSNYVKIKGVERPAVARLFDDANGDPQPYFIPTDLAKIHDFAETPDGSKTKFAAKIINSYITARLAFGIDVGYHAFRELGNVGAVLAREGSFANSAPWLGGRALAVERAYRTATLPHGDMLQLLAERGGFDRGTGFYVRENEPTQSLASKALHYGHEILFDPKKGIDTNLRRVVAESYIKTQLGEKAYGSIAEAVNAGKISPADGADAIGKMLGGDGKIGMKNFVNRTLGENNHLLRAGFLNKLQFVMPFVGQNIGTLPSELGRFATGNLSLKAVMAHAQRGEVARAIASVTGGLMSHALGAYLAANLLNYTMTSFDKDEKGNWIGGKWMWDNEEGHRLTPHILPGVYWTNMSPGDSRPARDTGVQTGVNKEDAVEGLKDIPRNITNEILGTIPLLAPIMGLAGKTPYITPGGDVMKASTEDINPFSIGSETVRATVQRMGDSQDEEPYGRAAAKDVAAMLGQRIKFEDESMPRKLHAPHPRAPRLRH